MADLGAGALFGAINTAFKFSEFAIELAEVGSENNVFVRTIQRVRLDLNETERLLRVPAIRASLANNPQKLFWIQQAINSTKCALNDIGLFVERVRSDQDRDDTVSFINRVRWVLNDHGKLENRRSELATCHQTLTTVLNTLHPVEMLASFSPTVASSPMAPPPTYESVSQVSDFTSPYNRKKRRMKVLETEIKDVKSVPELVPQEPSRSLESGTVVPQSDSQNIPETTRNGIQRSSTTSGISKMSASSALSFQATPRVEATGSLETVSGALDRPRAVSCTGTNLLGPINSWDMWKDYLERPSFPTPSSSQEPSDLQTPESLPVETQSSYTPASATSPLTTSLKPYELDEIQSPSMSQINYQQSICSTPVQHTTSPLEIDGLQITARPPNLYPAPLRQSRPMSTSLSELHQTTSLERPSTRRYTSFQSLNSPAEIMGTPITYEAYSKPHIPQLRPGMEQRETYPPPPSVPPYPNYLSDMPAPSPIDQAAPKFCPYPTDTLSMPTGLEYYSPPRRATSPALSFVSEVSAVESSGGGSEVSSTMHPALLRPGCQISRTAVSQSRRRRGLMEAALGVIGEK